jgi:glycosyltransferase involved in cell wall biosynthesis
LTALSPLRILFISAAADLSDHLPLGEGLIAHHLLAQLSSRGHDVVACVDRAYMQRDHGYRIIELAPAGRRLHSLWPVSRAIRARRVVRQLGGADSFDIAHWLRPYSWRMVSTRVVRDAGRVVIGPIGTSWPRASKRTGRRRMGDLPSAMLAPAVRGRYRRSLRNADVLLATLPEVRDGFNPTLGVKTVVTGMAVDIAAFEVTPLPKVPRVVFVGTFATAKGVLDLARAFPPVAKRLGAQLVFVGSGPQERELRACVQRLGISDSVQIQSPCPREQIPGVLASASVLCVPSVGEPFGMVFLEAMAAGRAMVGVDAGGPRHLITAPEGGRRVPPHDQAALSAALIEVLSDGDACLRMGHYNRARAEREFAMNDWVARLERVYRGGSW